MHAAGQQATSKTIQFIAPIVLYQFKETVR